MAAAITVLVADDEHDVRLLVRTVLEEAGFEVVAEVIDGYEALAAVVRLAPPLSRQ
jgi:CheY-like chemotaxis protein